MLLRYIDLIVLKSTQPVDGSPVDFVFSVEQSEQWVAFLILSLQL
jgi:hypothetical protein